MKVKPIFKSVNDLNRKVYFNYYGVYSIANFIKGVVDEDDEDYQKVVKDRQKMFKYAAKFISKYTDRPAYVLVDPDLDGYCSSAITIRNGLGLQNIMPVFHSKKQHGIDQEIVDAVPKNCILIIPDASIDVEWIDKLDEKNIVTVCIDHHPTLEDKNDTNNDKHCYICNGDVPQSGSMFMYQFVKFLGDHDICNAELGVLGNFGDVQEQNYLETRSINHLVEIPEHKFIKNMLVEFSDKKGYLYPDAVGWGMGPKVNAVIRSVNNELKRDIFACLAEDKCPDGIVTKCDDQHMWQKNHVKGITEHLVIDDHHNIIIVETEHDDEIVGVNGLIANRIQSQKNKPVFSVSMDEESGLLRGSLRSPVDIKTILNETGIVEAQGHERAAGIKFKPEDKDKLIEMMDKVDLGGDEMEVMLSCRPKELTAKAFEMFSSNDACGLRQGDKVVPYWGQGIPRPMVHMTYRTRYEDIVFLGRYKSEVNFYINGACQYSIHKDFIGRANKITWGIMIDTGIANRYGKTKLQQNYGAVDIELVGTLNNYNGKYVVEVQEWEFHPVSREEEYDVF